MRTVIVVDLKNWPRELRDLVRRDYRATLKAAEQSVFVDAPRWVQWSIRGGNAPAGYRQPIDTGDYAASWTSAKIKGGAVLYSASNPRIKAGVIEHGSRPGKMTPIEPLAAWVKRKLGIRDPNRAKSIAFAISRKHKKYGRKGLKVMERARPKILEAIKRNTVDLMKRAHKGMEGRYGN